MRKQSCAAPVAIQRLTEQLECATAYVDACLRTAGCVPRAHPTVESKKRKRASPFPGTHDRDFAEQLSMPGTPTMDLLPLLRGELRHYQLQGVRWLYSMYTNGLASILADESDEDRKVQVAGLVSCLRSKGMFGPVMLVAPAANQHAWAAHLQGMLGDGVQLHCLHDSSPTSLQALDQFCKTAAQRLSTYTGDVSAVPPSSVVLLSPGLLVQQQECLCQCGFKFLVMDTSRPQDELMMDTDMQVHHHHHHAASPCTSTVYSSAAACDGPTAVSSAHHHHHHHQAQVHLKQQRQSSCLGAAGRSRAPHHLASAPDQQQPQQQESQPKLQPATRQSQRRHGGPVTRSSSQPAAAVMDEGEDDPGHAQLVLSLSRLSSSGHAVDDRVTGLSYTEGVIKHNSDNTLTRCPVPRALSSSSLEPAGVLQPTQQACTAAGMVTACVKPPRPSASRASKPSAPQLTSVCSWPPHPNSGSAQAAPAPTAAAAAACSPGAGNMVQVPPWLTAHQQPVVWGPITRKRSSIVAQQHGAADVHQTAAGGVLSASQAPCEHAAAQVAEHEMEEAVGVNLSAQLVHAIRLVVGGPGHRGVLLLADVPVSEDCQLNALWPLLSLLLNSAAHPLHDCVQQAIQAGVLQPSGDCQLHQQLRGLISRFVLRRGSSTTSLDNLRRQGPECNLYDLFACAD